MEHVAGRGLEPRAGGTLHQRRRRLLRPHRRTPRTHGIRAIRRLPPPGLPHRRCVERHGRRQHHAFQRLESRTGDRADLRQRPAHHARHGLGGRGEPLREDLGCGEPLLQLGPPPHRRRTRRRRGAPRLPLRLARPHGGHLGIPERAALPRQPPHGGHRPLPLRRRGVEPLRRGRTQGRARRTGRQDAVRDGGLRRFPPAARPVADVRRRPARRPPLPRGHGVGAPGGALGPSAPRRGAESLGGQGVPLPHHPRDVHVSAPEPRPAARAAVELRTLVLAAADAPGPRLRGEYLLHRRREPHPARAGGRTPREHQLGPHPECGRRGPDRLAVRRLVASGRQLQLPAHEVPRAGGARTQALRRRTVRAAALERLHGRAVRRGTPHGARGRGLGLRQRGGVRAVEPALHVPRLARRVALGAGREPAGAALRDKRRIPHAPRYGHGRPEPADVQTTHDPNPIES